MSTENTDVVLTLDPATGEFKHWAVDTADQN